MKKITIVIVSPNLIIEANQYKDYLSKQGLNVSLSEARVVDEGGKRSFEQNRQVILATGEVSDLRTFILEFDKFFRNQRSSYTLIAEGVHQIPESNWHH